MIHCPTCAGGLRFEVESQMMACDHCGNRFNVNSIKDNERFDAKGHQLLDLYVFSCPDCGAELAVNDENDAVGFCPYCGGTSMLFDRVRQTWVPDGIIPFKVTKEQCKQAYLEEVRKHPFVSRKYSNPELVESFRGIYMPYWRFEGRQQEPFKVEKVETIDGKTKDKKIRRTYEQWYDISYRITGFSHDASSQFDDHTSEHLAPYRDEEIEKFHPGYLSGFYAEISDMDQGTYERYAKERCQDFTASQVDFDMTNAERRGIETEITSLSNVFYPVWFMSYRRKGKGRSKDKISYAAVNGQTGKISADLPLSPLRIVGASLVLTLALFALLSLFMGLLPSIKATDVLILCAVIAFSSTCFLGESCLGTLRQSLRLDDPSENGADKRSGTSDTTQPEDGNPETLSGYIRSKTKSSLGPKSPITMLFMSALAVLGIMLFATDGSYKGTLRFWGMIMGLAGSAYLLICAVSQMKYELDSKDALVANKTSQLENGIIETYSKYKTLFNVLRIVICVTCVIALFLGLGGILSKTACYAMCIVLAAEVLAYAAAQIGFQTKIAERKPPQMSKRGAFYDAN